MHQKSFSQLPENGFSETEILNRLNDLKSGNANWHEGKLWSLVYHESDEHHNFLKEAYATHFSENGLNPTAFPSLQKMERDVVQIAGNLFNAPDGFAGTMQSGGTESILCAMITYRDAAKKRGVKNPELLISDTAHVAFHKAAHYFDFALRIVPVDEHHHLNPENVRELVHKNTMAIVASAPAYPSGQIDPIEEISKIALETRVPLHVDACVGGFMLPFLKGIKPWDFRLPGVTSISADLHKYGFSSKGSSVLIWREQKWLEEQIFVYADWPGGVYASAGMLGTRPGGAYASAWSTLLKHGKTGYEKLFSDIMKTTGTLQRGIKTIEGLEILGSPDLSVFAVKSSDRKCSIYAVADALEEKGWFMDRQSTPESIHFTVTPVHSGKEEIFLSDLRSAVQTVRENPNRSLSGKAAQYGLISHLPARGFVKNEVRKTMAGIIQGNSAAQKEVPAWQKWLLKLIR